MLLEELTPRRKHRVLGTDIDERVLAKAKAGGPYTPKDLKQASKTLLLKNFTRVDGAYWVNQQFKQSLEFKRQNLLNEPFESGFDLVICRNVVIYFTEEAKQKLYEKFNRSLKENGVLFIGGTETLMDIRGLDLERIRNCFFRKRSVKVASRT